MRGIKIPLQDLALKLQGGPICGTFIVITGVVFVSSHLCMYLPQS